MSAAYLVGRRQKPAWPATSSTDALFAAERLDGQTLSGLTYEHCTFANISFKDAKFLNVRFVNCVFTDCYFRAATLTSAQFSGCKFISCDLDKVQIRTCDFKYYNSFHGCYIPYGELEQNLPGEGNLRAHLCLNLAAEARALGALKDAGLYQQAGARGREEHLRAALRHSSSFHQQKYNGWNRAAAGLDLLASRVQGRLWGYRRSFLVVLRNWALLTLAVFPILFFLLRDELRAEDGKPATALDALRASLTNTLPGSCIAEIEYLGGGAEALAFFEVLLGLLLAGLAASLLFRGLFDRWR